MRTGVRTLARAKALRREMSPPELSLWLRLKSPSEDCPRFRRQHPIGPWITDFYCPAAKLVVEIDGWGHNLGDQPARDERRDGWMRARGLTVLRIPASEVMADPDGVADAVVRQAMALVPPPPSRR